MVVCIVTLILCTLAAALGYGSIAAGFGIVSVLSLLFAFYKERHEEK